MELARPQVPDKPPVPIKPRLGPAPPRPPKPSISPSKLSPPSQNSNNESPTKELKTTQNGSPNISNSSATKHKLTITTRANSAETLSPTSENSSTRSKEPPPLPSSPPSAERRSCLSPSSTFSLPASFRNRSSQITNMHTPFSLTTLTPYTPTTPVSSSLPQKSPIRHVSPPRQGRPSTSPKPKHQGIALSPKSDTSPRTAPLSKQSKESDEGNLVSSKASIAKPDIKSTHLEIHTHSELSLSVYPVSKHTTSPPLRPTSPPSRPAPARPSYTPTSSKSPDITSVQISRKEEITTDIKPLGEKKPVVPPPLPKNPPRGGVPRKPRQLSFKTTLENKMPHAEGQQTPETTPLSHDRASDDTHVVKDTKLLSGASNTLENTTDTSQNNNEARPQTDQSNITHDHVNEPKNKTAPKPLPRTRPGLSPVNSNQELTNVKSLKNNKNNVCQNYVIEGAETSASLESEAKLEFSEVPQDTLDYEVRESGNKPEESISQNLDVNIHQSLTLTEKDSAISNNLLNPKQPNTNISLTSLNNGEINAISKNSPDSQNCDQALQNTNKTSAIQKNNLSNEEAEVNITQHSIDEIARIKRSFSGVSSSHSNESVSGSEASKRTSVSDDSKTLFQEEPEPTFGMLKEIEELLKNKLGDIDLDLETSPSKYSNIDNQLTDVTEHCLTGEAQSSPGDIVCSPDIDSSSSPSPVRPPRPKRQASKHLGSLESLNASVDNCDTECLTDSRLTKTSGSTSKKSIPPKPKRSSIPRVNRSHSDVTGMKPISDNNSSTSEASPQPLPEEVKPFLPPRLESLRRSESSTSCQSPPPLPPRNKTRSFSLKEMDGAVEEPPPLPSRSSLSEITTSSTTTPEIRENITNSSSSTPNMDKPETQLAQDQSKVSSSTTKSSTRLIPTRKAPPPPQILPKRSATFSSGDSKQPDPDQSSEQTRTADATPALASPTVDKSSNVLCKSSSTEEGDNKYHEISNVDATKGGDRPLSEASLQSSSSEQEGNGLAFGSVSTEEIVSSGTDTEPEEDKEEIYAQRKAKKVFFIAKEIVSSESTFVDVLKLLNLDFRLHISKTTENLGHPVIPTETMNRILDFLPQLQNFNEDLLKDLKERIDNWDTNPRLADIFVKKGPFLKLYSSYIRNFENATAVLEDTIKKNALFASALKEFELSPRCAKLALKHYMLKPIQRIPQYKLLLQDYLKHLIEGSLDYKDTVTALNIVSEVADHANNSMRYGDNVQKLLEVQRSLIGQFEVIQPGRILVKQGELQKLSRKEMQPRMFFLFNDVLLYTTPATSGYKINNVLSLTGMKINSPKLEDYKFEFNIISVQRSFTLSASSSEEKEQWVSALQKAIDENAKKNHTFQTVKQGPQTSLLDKDFVLGHKAPLWVPDARVTMCMLCLLEFTLTWRRHHCRSCGRVVCSHCSENKARLRYLKYEPARVCDNCFEKLKEDQASQYHQNQNKRKRLTISQSESDSTTSVSEEAGEDLPDVDNREDLGSDSVKHDSSLSLNHLLARFHKIRISNREKRRTSNFRPSVLKEVHANDEGSDMSGYLRAYKSRKWKRLWFVVKGKVLYTYKASEDMAATESMPLLGYEVTRLNTWFEGAEPDLLFELTHQNNQPLTMCKEGNRVSPCVVPGTEKTTQRLIFRTDSAAATTKWVTVLREASLTYQ